MYYGARYYDSALSRFITPDTVYDRSPQGLNRYSYALNNPVRYNDPSGHMSNPFATFFRGLHSSPVGKLVGNLMRNEAQATAEAAEHQVTPPEQDAGVVEGSFPIWGDGKDSYLAFKEGKILYGVLYGIMALNDVADGGVSPEDAAKAGIRGGRGLAEKALKGGDEFIEGASKSGPKLLSAPKPRFGTSLSDVSKIYFKTGKLPDNFITKKQAKALGWNPKKCNLVEVAPGKSIGGDVFKNKEGLLPSEPGRTWYEADLNYSGGYRGSERFLYSNDGLIYYTGDHYKTFQKLGAR